MVRSGAAAGEMDVLVMRAGVRADMELRFGDQN